MTNLYPAANVLTSQNIAIPCYVGSLPTGKTGTAVAFNNNIYYYLLKGTWTRFNASTNGKTEFDKYIGNSILKFMTSKTAASIARIYDIADENGTIYVLTSTAYATASNWKAHHQDAFNIQATKAATEIVDQLNSILTGTADETYSGDYTSKIVYINKCLADIREAIKNKSTDPGADISTYDEAINRFQFAPYAPSKAAAPVTLKTKPGYFVSSLSDSDVPLQNTNVVVAADSWFTGYNMYYNGDFTATRVYNAVWNDYAEFFEQDIDNKWQEGEVICLNPTTGLYTTCTGYNNNLVVGIASKSYGSIVGGKYDKIEDNYNDFIPVALAGRVKVKVDYLAEIGDILISSDTAGCATKMVDPYASFGCILGKVVSVNSATEVTILVMRG